MLVLDERSWLTCFVYDAGQTVSDRTGAASGLGAPIVMRRNTRKSILFLFELIWAASEARVPLLIYVNLREGGQRETFGLCVCVTCRLIVSSMLIGSTKKMLMSSCISVECPLSPQLDVVADMSCLLLSLQPFYRRTVPLRAVQCRRGSAESRIDDSLSNNFGEK